MSTKRRTLGVDHDPFKHPTAATSEGEALSGPESLAAANAGAGTRQAQKGRERAAQGPPSDSGAHMSKVVRSQWRTRLRSAAGQVASAERHRREIGEAWAALVAEARAAGVPDSMVTAALLDAEVELPER